MNMSKPDEGSAHISPDDWERIARYLTGEAGVAEAEATGDRSLWALTLRGRAEIRVVRGELELPTAYDQPRELTPRLAGVLLVGDAEALESWKRSDAQERELERGDRRARSITAIATMQVSRHSLAET